MRLSFQCLFAPNVLELSGRDLPVEELDANAEKFAGNLFPLDV
jgi:hypothetical protein